jgi:site-specific DNA-methyltransferase (adenine-specific)
VDILKTRIMKITDKIKIFNMDCIDFLKTCKDNQFDLSIVDVPYGIGFSSYSRGGKVSLKTKQRHTKNGIKNWDDSIPSDEYWKELFRVSINVIAWGANYIPYLWTNGCKGFIYWHKGNPVDNFSDGELAYTSFNRPAKQFDYRYYGNLDGKTSASEKIHPTQKPIQLYQWLLDNYAKQGDKILDTHLGSGSIAIACHDYGFELTACELDKEYYDKAIERIKNHVSQQKLF